MPGSTAKPDPEDTRPWGPPATAPSSPSGGGATATTRMPSPTAPWSAPAPGAPGKRRWAAVVTLLLLCAGYAVYLGRQFEPAISTPDANGYWAQGTLLSRTGRTWFRTESPLQYVGMHWLILPDGRYVSRYPPGLPVLIAAVDRLFGPQATVLINPALAILSLVGLFFLARRFVPDPWSVLPSALMAVTPIFTRHALACDSHMAVLFCLVWGLTFLLLWSNSHRLWAVFAAGLLLGAIPAIRYPETLFALGVGVFLLFHARSHRPFWRHVLVGLAGAAVPIVPLLIRNQLLMGAFWRTGYSLTNEQTGFAWSYFREHVFQYIQNIHAEGVGLFFAVGALGAAAMCAMPRLRARGWLLVLTTVPITVLYMFYYWAPDRMAGATMRFVLPTFACYYTAGVWALAEVARRLPRAPGAAVVGTLLTLQLLWGAPAAFGNLAQLVYPKKVLARVTRTLETKVDPSGVILTDRLLLQHLDFVREWKLADAGLLRQRPGGRRPRRLRGNDPDAPQPMQAEKNKVRGREYARLFPAHRQRRMAEDLRKWADGHKVYFVGTEDELEDLPGPCFSSENFRIKARVALPEPPPMKRRGRFAGRLGGALMKGAPGAAGAKAAGPPPDMAPPPAPGNPVAGLRRMPELKRLLRRVGGLMGGPGAFMGARELVIAEWTWTPEQSGSPAQPPAEPVRKRSAWGPWK